jgi:hypothetical protein
VADLDIDRIGFDIDLIGFDIDLIGTSVELHTGSDDTMDERTNFGNPVSAQASHTSLGIEAGSDVVPFLYVDEGWQNED